MKRITINLNDRDLSVYDYIIEDENKTNFAECDNGTFLFIDHVDGHAYFNVNAIQFFEITEEVTDEELTN